MTTLHHEILINAPVEKVFATLSDLTSVRHYNPLVKTVEIISPNPTGAGSARHCVFKDGKFAKERVTASVPNQSISFDLYEHQWPLAYMRWTNRLQADGIQTRLIADTEYAPGMGLLGKLMDALMMKRQFAKVIAQSLAQMKTHIEAQR
jgi:uncharacterized protein YndB with AHSA1/START domain